MREQIIRFRPAWNKVDPNPSKNYGIGAMSIWFYLKGELAVVQFHISTGWYLEGDRNPIVRGPFKEPETREEVLKRRKEYSFLFGTNSDRTVAVCDYYDVVDLGKPKGYDVGYHSPVALYEGQLEREGCEFFPSPGKCFYDGSSLRADEWAKKFVGGGTDWLWSTMDQELSEIEERVREQQAVERNFS